MQVLQDGLPVTDITPGSDPVYLPGFVVGPADSPPRLNLATPADWLQFRADGVDVGDAFVAIVDFVSDPSVCAVTRGVGENSHVITLRIPPLGGGGGGPEKKPGWMTDILSGGSTPLHANEGYGAYQDYIAEPGVTITHETYAGIENYAGEVVVWTPTWVPLYADPSPTVTPLSGGRVEVYWSTIGGGFPVTSEGMLTLECTIDGSPAGGSIEIEFGGGAGYGLFAWGPVP